jgi:hypothetical protein
MYYHTKFLKPELVCTTSAFWDEPRRLLKVIRRFGKQCSYHLQGEYLLVGHFWRPYIQQAADGEQDVKDLIGGAEERAATAAVRRIHPEDGNCNVCRNVG